MQIKIKTPAKINLGLVVLGKREDGFHDILSVMQTISLYDYLTFQFTKSEHLEINLSGSVESIPYNEKNLVYRAIKLFYSKVPNLPKYKISVYIEKHIPQEAGLGGGSSNAAGAIWALNKVLGTNLSDDCINELCGELGSDLNVCYWGGTCLATSRGEKVEKINSRLISDLSIIKPYNFGISAKDGYLMFDELNQKTSPEVIEKLKDSLISGKSISSYTYNDLEIAPLKKFDVLKKLKKAYPDAIMTGSGSAYFVLNSNIPINLPNNEYQVITGLKFITDGISEV